MGLNQGADDDNRIGNQCSYRNLNFNVEIRPNSSSTIDQTYVLLIIYDKQINGLQASISDMFFSADPLGFGNLDNRFRFKTLYSSGPFSMGSLNNGAVPSSLSWQINIKGNFPLMFSGGTASDADVRTGGIYFVVKSTAGTGPEGHLFRSFSRHRFTDGRANQKVYVSNISTSGGLGTIKKIQASMGKRKRRK